MKSRIVKSRIVHRLEQTDEFKRVHKESEEYGESKDCAVKAVAILSGLSYGYVRRLFLHYGRKHGKGSPKNVTLAVLNELGLRHYTIGHQAKSVAQCEKHLDPSLKYLVFTRGHVLAVTGGKAHCWTRGRKHRPVSIMRVL